MMTMSQEERILIRMDTEFSPYMMLFFDSNFLFVTLIQSLIFPTSVLDSVTLNHFTVTERLFVANFSVCLITDMVLLPTVLTMLSTLHT
jgi:hypothetical protein